MTFTAHRSTHASEWLRCLSLCARLCVCDDGYECVLVSLSVCLFFALFCSALLCFALSGRVFLLRAHTLPATATHSSEKKHDVLCHNKICIWNWLRSHLAKTSPTAAWPSNFRFAPFWAKCMIQCAFFLSACFFASLCRVYDAFSAIVSPRLFLLILRCQRKLATTKIQNIGEWRRAKKNLIKTIQKCQVGLIAVWNNRSPIMALWNVLFMQTNPLKRTLFPSFALLFTFYTVNSSHFIILF